MYFLPSFLNLPSFLKEPSFLPCLLTYLLFLPSFLTTTSIGASGEVLAACGGGSGRSARDSWFCGEFGFELLDARAASTRTHHRLHDAALVAAAHDRLRLVGGQHAYLMLHARNSNYLRDTTRLLREMGARVSTFYKNVAFRTCRRVLREQLLRHLSHISNSNTPPTSSSHLSAADIETIKFVALIQALIPSSCYSAELRCAWTRRLRYICLCVFLARLVMTKILNIYIR